jgi:hypothetical protein
LTDHRIEKWRHWLEKGISNDIYGMNLRRFAWKRMEEIARANETLSATESYFWEFQFEIYAATQAVAVRRQTDAYDNQVASLGRLIQEIRETPEIVTREWWIGLWGQDETRPVEKELIQEEAGRAWDEHYAGNVGEHFDPEIAKADLKKLLEGAEKVRAYVDSHVAHFDAQTIPRPTGQPEVVPSEAPAPKGGIPTLNEVHDAIDLIGDLFKQYGNLMTASSWVDLVPVLQHDWERVFRIQWLPEPPEPEPLRLAREWREKRSAEKEGDEQPYDDGGSAEAG